MTLASEDGSRSLKKPYVQGEVASLPNSRWRMCLLSWSFLLSSVFFVLLLSDNFGPSRSIAMTTTSTTSTKTVMVATPTPQPPTPTTRTTTSTTTTTTTTATISSYSTTTSTAITKPNTMLGPLIRAAVVDAVAAASTTSGSGTTDTAVHIPHNPWIPSGFLEDYIYNSVARSSTCLQHADSAGVVGAVIISGGGLGARSGNRSSSSSNAAAAAAAAASGVEGNDNNNDQCLDDHDEYYKLGNVSEFATVTTTTAEKKQQQQLPREQHGESAVRSLCEAGSAERARLLRRSRLGFCDRFTLARVLGEPVLQQLARANGTECAAALDRLRRLDERAQRIFCEFDEILTRYDCLQNYSIRWACDDCRGAYKAWVCSMLIPFHEGANHMKPCRDVCHTVEKKCPYFLPDTKLQYAGEPTFLCIDPDIPETETVSSTSSYGVSPTCYLRCHQDADFCHRRPPHSELNLQLHPIHPTHSVRWTSTVQGCEPLSLATATTTSDNSTSSSNASAVSSTWRTENAASSSSSSSSSSSVTSFWSSAPWHHGGRGCRHYFPTHHPYPYVVTVLTLGILRLSRTFLTPPPFCLGLT